MVPPSHINTRVSRSIERNTDQKTPLGSIDVDHIDSVELRQTFYAATDRALDALPLSHETREQIAAELRLVVRPPTEDTAKRPRIGLGALLPDEK